MVLAIIRTLLQGHTVGEERRTSIEDSTGGVVGIAAKVGITRDGRGRGCRRGRREILENRKAVSCAALDRIIACASHVALTVGHSFCGVGEAVPTEALTGVLDTEEIVGGAKARTEGVRHLTARRVSAGEDACPT